MSFRYSSDSFNNSSDSSGLSNSRSSSVKRPCEYSASPNDPQRNELLNQNITGITIGLSTMTPNTASIKCAIALIFSHASDFFKPVLYHASILLHFDEETKNGAIIEFGKYANDSAHDHPQKVHYWNRDGVRFSQMTYDEYKKYVHPVLFCHNFHFFDCYVKNKITVNELLQQIMNDGSWRKSDYNVNSKNCQHFASKVICKLRAYRHHYDFLSNVKYDKALVPEIILHSLYKIECPHYPLIYKEDDL